MSVTQGPYGGPGADPLEPLSPDEAAFVDAVLEWRNVRRAGAQVGLSGTAAEAMAARDPVRRAVTRHYEQGAMTAEEALVCLSEIARGEWGAYLEIVTDPEGNPEIAFNLGQMAGDRKGYLLASLVRGRSGAYTAKFPDRLPALRMLLEYHGALGEGTSPEEIEALLRRYDRPHPNGATTEALVKEIR
jgi:hypothetical protein